jgi:hypothetical protein
MIRRLLLVALRWTSYNVGYGLRMGWEEAGSKIRPASLKGLVS